MVDLPDEVGVADDFVAAGLQSAAFGKIVEVVAAELDSGLDVAEKLLPGVALCVVRPVAVGFEAVTVVVDAVVEGAGGAESAVVVAEPVAVVDAEVASAVAVDDDLDQVKFAGL